MSPEIYQTCAHTESSGMNVKCLNEGWLFCTLCHAYYCEDHVCVHLAPQVNRDAIREVNENEVSTSDNPSSTDSPANDSDLDKESSAFFRELSAQQLLDKSEMELRSYFRRILREAHRVKREIERRMIYATELHGGPAYRRRLHPSGDAVTAGKAKKLDTTPLGLMEREVKEAAARVRQQKKQQTIQASIELLMQQAKLGNISIEQIKKLGAKK